MPKENLWRKIPWIRQLCCLRELASLGSEEDTSVRKPTPCYATAGLAETMSDSTAWARGKGFLAPRPGTGL